jgi:excisionase family DNA binding protein
VDPANRVSIGNTDADQQERMTVPITRRLSGELKMTDANTAAPTGDRGFSTLAAAKILGVSDWLVRKSIKARGIRAVRIGKRVIVPASEVSRILGGTVGQPTAAA